MKNFMENDLSKVCEVKLVYKTKYNISERPHIRQPNDCYKIFRDSWDMDTIEHKESFKLMLLNRSNRVLGVCSISEGGINGTIIDVRIIMQYAIKANANGIILCHNHPSGNLSSSESDKAITKKVKDAGVLLDITLLDHIIITKSYYKSLMDN